MNKIPKIYEDFEFEIQKIMIRLGMSRSEYLKFISVSLISILKDIDYSCDEVKGYLDVLYKVFELEHEAVREKEL
jgi:hypothetical protein